MHGSTNHRGPKLLVIGAPAWVSSRCLTPPTSTAQCDAAASCRRASHAPHAYRAMEAPPGMVHPVLFQGKKFESRRDSSLGMGATTSRWEGAFRNTGNVLYLDLGAAHMDVVTLLTGVLNTYVLCVSLYV